MQLLVLTGCLVVVMVGGMLWLLALINQRETEIKNAVSQFENTQLQLEDLADSQFKSSSKLTIFGQLTVDGGLIIPPSDPPANPKPGQIYYDKTTNELRYFNGSTFVPFAKAQ
jgi:hypothetical protein